MQYEQLKEHIENWFQTLDVTSFKKIKEVSDALEFNKKEDVKTSSMIAELTGIASANYVMKDESIKSLKESAMMLGVLCHAAHLLPVQEMFDNFRHVIEMNSHLLTDQDKGRNVIVPEVMQTWNDLVFATWIESNNQPNIQLTAHRKLSFLENVWQQTSKQAIAQTQAQPVLENSSGTTTNPKFNVAEFREKMLSTNQALDKIENTGKLKH